MLASKGVLDVLSSQFLAGSRMPICSVMVESFISTQKTSVQKEMAKRFRRYLMHKQDLNDLVMHALQVSHACMNSSVSMPLVNCCGTSVSPVTTYSHISAHLLVMLLVMHAGASKAT